MAVSTGRVDLLLGLTLQGGVSCDRPHRRVPGLWPLSWGPASWAHSPCLLRKLRIHFSTPPTSCGCCFPLNIDQLIILSDLVNSSVAFFWGGVRGVGGKNSERNLTSDFEVYSPGYICVHQEIIYNCLIIVFNTVAHILLVKIKPYTLEK